MPPETTPSFSQPIASSVPPVRLGKFKASRMIARQSWAILKQDKEIMWFPVLSMIASLIALAILAAIAFPSVFSGNTDSLDNSGGVGYYVTLLVYYIVTFFIVNFFQTGILVIAHARFKGENVSFRDGMREASKNAGKLLVWSAISATVGMILRIIADKLKFVGKIIAVIFGAAWNILTYFSLPSLIIGKTSIKGSFKESAQIIRKTWGESIIINFGLGAFFALLVIVAMLVAMVVVIAVPSALTFIVVGVFFALFILAIAIVSSTLGTIFKLALYEYARTGTVPQGFSPELVQGAVTGK